jgi:uncharacterized protein YndB with AHSA1/START domain
MKWLLFALLVVVSTVIIVLVVGWMLPVSHVASRSASLNATPETVWRTITDVDAFPTWRSGVRKVERLPDRNGHQVWAEDGTTGRITLAVERSEPPHTLVTRIADPDLPFGGTWTYRITPTANGCTLTITENGEIYNPVFRAMARFVFGYESTMAAYLDGLKKVDAGR